MIPHTGEETTLLRRTPGDIVNLENDIVGKYIEKLVQGAASPYVNDTESAAEGTQSRKAGEQGTGLTMDYLREMGF